MPMIVPPGGYAAFAQHTPATKAAWFTPSGRRKVGGGRKRRRRAAAKAARRAKRTQRGRKMKFGSPQWQKKYRVGKFAKKRRA